MRYAPRQAGSFATIPCRVRPPPTRGVVASSIRYEYRIVLWSDLRSESRFWHIVLKLTSEFFPPGPIPVPFKNRTSVSPPPGCTQMASSRCRKTAGKYLLENELRRGPPLYIFNLNSESLQFLLDPVQTLICTWLIVTGAVVDLDYN